MSKQQENLWSRTRIDCCQWSAWRFVCVYFSILNYLHISCYVLIEYFFPGSKTISQSSKNHLRKKLGTNTGNYSNIFYLFFPLTSQTNNLIRFPWILFHKRKRNIIALEKETLTKLNNLSIIKYFFTEGKKILWSLKNHWYKKWALTLVSIATWYFLSVSF